MIYQTIDFETDCKRVSTLLRRMAKKYPEFTKIWGEWVEHVYFNIMPENHTQYYVEKEQDYVIGLDCEVDGHFYVWFQARDEYQVFEGEGTIYNVNKDIEIDEQTAQNTHNTYRDTQSKIVLLDLIYLALYELQTITIAREWVGTNEFDFFDDDVVSHDFTCAWFNFWLRCFNKDFLNACKIQVGFLNHKLNKEIERNECVTSYAEYLFYLQKQVKDAYKRLRGC